MFYKETKFQDSFIGKIPKDWKATKLTDVADYINGFAFSPEDWKTEGLPIIRIQNLNDLEAESNYFDGKIDEKYLVRNGDLLFAWSASIGCYLWNRGDAWLNQHIFKVTPKQGIDRQYLYYTLFMAIKQLEKRVHGSTMQHFRRGELTTALIPLPLEKEQRAIAKVLADIDSSIELADKVIAKTERLKKGLMQQLLTRGIGHKEFKGTQLGKTPKEWELVKLGKVAFISKLAGFEFTKYLKYDENGKIMVLRAINIQNHQLQLSDVKRIAKTLSDSLPRSKVFKDDIVFTYIGVNIGQAAVIPESNRFHLGANVAKISITEKDRLSSLFLMFVIESQIIKNQIIATRSTTAQPSLNMSKIRDLEIPLPPLEEQQKIAEILSTLNRKLRVENMEKRRLVNLKQGLMDLLLTGKVRIKVD